MADHIEKMFPRNGKLKKKNKVATTIIVDADINPIECEFAYDACIDLNVDDHDLIKLSIDNLENMILLIKQSEIWYDKVYKDLD